MNLLDYIRIPLASIVDFKVSWDQVGLDPEQGRVKLEYRHTTRPNRVTDSTSWGVQHTFNGCQADADSLRLQYLAYQRIST